LALRVRLRLHPIYSTLDDLSMAAAAKQLDDTIEIVTPENIAFEYRLAGPFRRLVAYAVDLALRIAAFVGLSIALSTTLSWFIGAAITGVILILFFLLSWFYGGLFETFMNGQTPGKRMLGIRVLTISGQPINGMQAIMRNILRTADELPLLSLHMFIPEAPPFYIIPTFVLGLIVMTCNRRFQRMGDLVCGTMVVVEDRQWLTGVIRLEDPRAAQLSEYIPANFVVTRTMARAIASYVDRRRFFSPARRREVARYLAEPLLKLFQLPADTSYDLLLCALYHRTFVLEKPDEKKAAPRPMPTQSPPTPSQPLFLR
jgi:uncharacterized RDD family membrane protein YckC